MRTKIRAVQNALIVMLLLALVFTIFQVWHIQFSHSLEIKPYTTQIIAIQDKPQLTLTKQTARTTIANLFNTPHIYREKDLPAQENGRSKIMWRVVQIDKDLDVHTYIITYAHELCHVRYQVGNETYTAYMTFVRLYKNNNAELQYHALIYAKDVISGDYSGTEYDCGYYILEYLKGANYDGTIKN